MYSLCNYIKDLFERIRCKFKNIALDYWNFVGGFHRGSMDSPHKEPVMPQAFPGRDFIMFTAQPTKHLWLNYSESAYFMGYTVPDFCRLFSPN